MLTRFRLTVDVINERAVTAFKPQLLFVQEFKVYNLSLAFQKGIEENEQDGLGYLLSEDAFKAYISKRVDELAHACLFFAMLAQR